MSKLDSGSSALGSSGAVRGRSRGFVAALGESYGSGGYGSGRATRKARLGMKGRM